MWNDYKMVKKNSYKICIHFFKPVSQSSIIENTPNASTDLFFLGSHVVESQMHCPLNVKTGQLGLGLDTQLKDFHQHIYLKLPSLQCLGAVEQETLQKQKNKMINDPF